MKKQKPVDKFEDNCVENEQNHHVMSAWIDYLSVQHVAKDQQQHAAELIQQVFDAIENGDSCLACTWQQAECLGSLVVQFTDENQQEIRPFVYVDGGLYLYRYWFLESQLAQLIQQFKTHNAVPITLQERHLKLLEDPHQQKAMQMVARERLSIITGGPGTGKTYTLARIIAVLNESIPNIRIAMAAPTGKAAQRMKEALQSSYTDEKLSEFISEDLQRLTPVTLHRLLGLGESQVPRYHAGRPLPFDVVVVDEASMLDLQLARSLFAALGANARLILLGDAEQLASVDVGAVLADLQQVELLKENRINLVTSRRFDGEQLIGRMAKFIQQNASAIDVKSRFENEIVAPQVWQKVVLSANQKDIIQLQYLPQPSLDFHSSLWNEYYTQLMYGFERYVDAIQDYLHTDIEAREAAFLALVDRFDDYRILTPMRHGRLGLVQLNEHIEQRVLRLSSQSKQGEWYVGRPVMMTYNDYQLGLSNGDIGICVQKKHQGKWQFAVYFPSLQKWVMASRLPKNILTAYAMTIHKSQGSEFKHTAVVLEAAAQQLLSKELIYTAITRAKKVVSLLVDPTAFEVALTRQTMRTTGLQHKLNTLSVSDTYFS